MKRGIKYKNLMKSFLYKLTLSLICFTAFYCSDPTSPVDTEDDLLIDSSDIEIPSYSTSHFNSIVPVIKYHPKDTSTYSAYECTEQYTQTDDAHRIKETCPQDTTSCIKSITPKDTIKETPRKTFIPFRFIYDITFFFPMIYTPSDTISDKKQIKIQ